MADEQKSLLYKLEPLIKRMPAVTKPEGHVHFKSKLLWTLVSLIAYFFMANVFIYGLSSGNVDVFAQFRAILAGQNGSLVHLGIGPIVTGSIIMQLFTGAKIIKLDLTKPEDKGIYQGTQKVLVILMIFVEAVPQVFGFLQPAPSLDAKVGGHSMAQALIIVQLAAGSYIVFLLDEVVSKWGMGSGISLFIAAGVSQTLFIGTFNWVPPCAGQAYSIVADCTTANGTVANIPPGTFPRTLYLLSAYDTSQLVHGGGFETIFMESTNALVAFLGTLAIFLIVVYAESSRVELPLAHGKVRGARGRYPIRLLYSSNIPVILMAALLANVNLISLLLYQGPLRDLPLFGYNWLVHNAPSFQGWVGTYLPGGGRTQAITGFAYYFQPFSNGVQDWLLPFLNPDRYGPRVFTYREPWQVVVRIACYGGAMIGGSIIFAKFWIETTNMGPDAVAKQIQSSGMQIPGFRRDPRIVEKILERYIPVVTVIGGAAVGALAFSADMIGTVGNASGTGVLLTVGILQRLYEQIAKEQVMEMHPILRGFFGE
ncbi:MAG: preprotein translocase subunit SecY [Halobacteriales archaeon]|nr:preprotein translocase subunit SecY [Halobacteriales archaeon]